MAQLPPQHGRLAAARRHERRPRLSAPVAGLVLLVVTLTASLILVLFAWDEDTMFAFLGFAGLQAAAGVVVFTACRFFWLDCDLTLPAMAIQVAAAQSSANLFVLFILAAAEMHIALGLALGMPLWGPAVALLARALLQVSAAEAALPTVGCVALHLVYFVLSLPWFFSG